jgi:hypothetical protein
MIKIYFPPHFELEIHQKSEKIFHMDVLYDNKAKFSHDYIGTLTGYFDGEPSSEDASPHWVVILSIVDSKQEMFSDKDCRRLLIFLNEQRYLHEPARLFTSRYYAYDSNNRGPHAQIGRIYEDDPDPYLEPVDK